MADLTDKEKAGKWIYLHMLDGKPAFFTGDQVCFASYNTVRNWVTSLKQIRHEQKLSAKWRETNKITVPFRYGYMKVLVRGRSNG